MTPEPLAEMSNGQRASAEGCHDCRRGVRNISVLEFNNAGNAQANQQHCDNQAYHEDDEGSEAEFLHLAPKPPPAQRCPMVRLFPARADEKVFIVFSIFHDDDKILRSR